MTGLEPLSYDAEVAARVRVVRGTPDDDELVALVAGLAAAAANATMDGDDPAAPTSAWMDRSRTMHGRRQGVLGRGDNSWRHSLR